MPGSNESLSLLYITQYFPPETGAAPTRVDALTKRWSEAGHDVTVLTSAPDYPEGEVYNEYDNEWLHREDRNGVTVYMTKTIPASNKGFLRRTLKFIWFMLAGIFAGVLFTRPDVVIGTSPQPFVGVTGWVVSRLRRAQFVFEVRDLWPESITATSDLDNVILIRCLDALVTFLYRRADRIVVISEGFNPALFAAGVEENNIWFHPNGVEPSFFDRADNRWMIETELRETLRDRFVVSYVGTIGRAHGLSVVIDAAEQFHKNPKYEDVLFVFVGFGAKADQLQQMATERNLNNVQFLGRRPKSAVPDLLELSDVALVHLKDRALFKSAIPSKMFEAMASGTPIALGVRGVAERIVEDGQVGLAFEPESSTSLVEVLQQFYNATDTRERFGANGRTYVRNNFSWDNIADAYKENIESLAFE